MMRCFNTMSIIVTIQVYVQFDGYSIHLKPSNNHLDPPTKINAHHNIHFL